ncbi:MAG: hypothetical protein WB473_08215 [Pedococcus sp.]
MTPTSLATRTRPYSVVVRAPTAPTSRHARNVPLSTMTATQVSASRENRGSTRARSAARAVDVRLTVTRTRPPIQTVIASRCTMFTATATAGAGPSAACPARAQVDTSATLSIPGTARPTALDASPRDPMARDTARAASSKMPKATTR